MERYSNIDIISFSFFFFQICLFKIAGLFTVWVSVTVWGRSGFGVVLGFRVVLGFGLLRSVEGWGLAN